MVLSQSHDKVVPTLPARPRVFGTINDPNQQSAEGGGGYGSKRVDIGYLSLSLFYIYLSNSGPRTMAPFIIQWGIIGCGCKLLNIHTTSPITAKENSHLRVIRP